MAGGVGPPVMSCVLSNASKWGVGYIKTLDIFFCHLSITPKKLLHYTQGDKLTPVWELNASS